MFLSRKEGMLGDEPVAYRSYQAAKKRRFRKEFSPAHPAENEFFGTSRYGAQLETATRSREVERLFARMRNELIEIAQEFADESPASSAPATVRTGLFVEMVVASEFVADELDSVIAALCQAGAAAKERGAGVAQLDRICKQAVLFARLRNRVCELQRELDTMVEISLRPFRTYSVNSSLNFDPIAQTGGGGRPFVILFMQAVDESINVLSSLSSRALQERDFETVAELCTCSVQLTNFLSDARRILAGA